MNHLVEQYILCLSLSHVEGSGYAQGVVALHGVKQSAVEAIRHTPEPAFRARESKSGCGKQSAKVVGIKYAELFRYPFLADNHMVCVFGQLTRYNFSVALVNAV
jgi:hypothetical protein